MNKIIIQAGHNKPFPWLGFGTGTAGEADYVKSLAGKLLIRFMNNGWSAHVVGAKFDYSLAAGVFLSLHCDGSHSPAARGFSIGWDERLKNAAASSDLAKKLKDSYTNTNIPFRGYNTTIDMRHYYAFKRLRHVNAAVLLETGFLTNSADKSILHNNIEKIAAFITEGIQPFAGKNAEKVNPPTKQPPNMPLLRRGATGPHVALAQKRLMAHRVNLKYGADGIFGPATEAAVKQFQQARRNEGRRSSWTGGPLDVDGIIGRDVWALLLSPPG